MGRFVAQILCIEGAFMLPALLIALYDGDQVVVRAFLMTIGLIFGISGALFAAVKGCERRFFAREGLVCVALGWIIMSLLGCLPFYLSGEIPSYVDALFEIVSGFTTTGSSIHPNIESMSRGNLYWRSFSHWLGGMGVLVFLLAIVPNARGKGREDTGFTMHILRAESPGPSVGKLVPKMRKTASILYIMYIVLTVINILFLLAGGMPWFDSLCTAFGTAGTGGFGIKNDSMAGYSPYLQNVTTVFMLLFGVNFSCYYLLLLRQIRNVFKDEELRFYIGMVAGSIALITWNVRDYYDTLGETIRHAAFQVASIVTTTGYATTDFDLWPSFSKTILLCLMFVGACAGSTGGGMKCSRVLLLLKNLYRNIRAMIHPQKVQVVRNNGQVVNEKVLSNVNAYLAAYVTFIIVSIILVSLDGFSMETNISAVVSCFNNIGPGFDAVGPVCNFSGYSAFSKIILTLDMLTGRLEIFPILILFSRNTWRNR